MTRETTLKVGRWITVFGLLFLTAFGIFYFLQPDRETRPMTVILGGIATCLLSCYLVYKVPDRSYREGSGRIVGVAVLLVAVGVGLGLCAVVGRLLGWI